jgi:hypothetical protein
MHEGHKVRLCFSAAFAAFAFQGGVGSSDKLLASSAPAIAE